MLTPMPEKIIAKPIDPEEEHSSNIILPENREKNRPMMARIVSVGEYVSEALKPGQIVLFEQYGASPLSHEGEEFLVLDEPLILAVILQKEATRAKTK